MNIILLNTISLNAISLNAILWNVIMWNVILGVPFYFMSFILMLWRHELYNNQRDGNLFELWNTGPIFYNFFGRNKLVRLTFTNTFTQA